MNAAFFQQIECILHTERIDAYRQDGADAKLTLARYCLNMALSEALYPSLQFAEIALRNKIHHALTVRCGTDAWYDLPRARLTGWQQDRVNDAKNSVRQLGKPTTPGRIVAELNFGFWTGFFNNSHARTASVLIYPEMRFPTLPRQSNTKPSSTGAGKISAISATASSITSVFCIGGILMPAIRRFSKLYRGSHLNFTNWQSRWIVLLLCERVDSSLGSQSSKVIGR